MKPLLPLPTVIVLCACVAACGAASKENGSAPTRLTSGSTEATTASTARSLDAHNSGDYDRDDLVDGQSVNDGDNDDSTGQKDRDGDSDNSSNTYYDKDDRTVRGFGHAASAADRRAIAALVKRYYMAAAAADGTTACSTIESSIAKAVPEALGTSAGPSYARGDTCAVVMSKIFRASHRQLAAYAARIQVARVRLDRGSGLAVLSFGTLPARQIPVIREGSAWKLEAVLDSELP